MLCHSMLCANRLASVLSALPLSLRYPFHHSSIWPVYSVVRPISIFHKPQTVVRWTAAKVCAKRCRQASLVTLPKAAMPGAQVVAGTRKALAPMTMYHLLMQTCSGLKPDA